MFRPRNLEYDLKASFAMRWRVLRRGRVEERAVAVAPDGRGEARVRPWRYA